MRKHGHDLPRQMKFVFSFIDPNNPYNDPLVPKLKALGNYPNANIAWHRAIANLPPSLSAVETEQKRRWEKFIRDNNEKMAPRYPNIHPEDVQRAMQHNMPWQRAIIVCDELTARGGGGGGSTNGMESSAWSILEAHKVWSYPLFSYAFS